MFSSALQSVLFSSRPSSLDTAQPSSQGITLSATRPPLGWIGTGVMGRPMVEHLLRHGFPVSVYNRTRSRAEPLLAAGATWCDSPAEVAATSEIVCSIVGMPSDVESIYFGNRGVFSAFRPRSIVCDLTTSRPELAKRLATTAQTLGAAGLDAPVTGAEIGAIRGTLSIFVGGDATAFERIRPVLSAFGQKILRFGDAGAGQQAKLANQIALAGAIIGVCESIRFAQKAGLHLHDWWELVKSGASGSTAMVNLGGKILDNDMSPGFFVEHFIKDLGICLDECRQLELQLPGLELAERLYRETAVHGFARSGIQSLFSGIYTESSGQYHR